MENFKDKDNHKDCPIYFKKRMINMKKIAIYGKGGILKSSNVSYLAVALIILGKSFNKFGCYLKAVSNISHHDGQSFLSVLDALRQGKEREEDIVYKSDDGVYCIESGGPIPGNGCAGRGIIAAFEKIKELNLFEKYHPDYELFDVLGDVVCGGFAMPIRNGYADDLYIVTYGEMMSLYAADNILKAVRYQKKVGYATFKGLIINQKGIANEEAIVLQAAQEMDANIFYSIPRSSYIQEAEKMKKTVVEAFKDADITQHYFKLAQKIIDGDKNEN